MHIKESVDLKDYTTMRLGGQAKYLAEAHSENDVKKLADWALKRDLTIIMIGQGSNIFWRDEGFSGLVIVNQIKGRDILAKNDSQVTVRIGAGEGWDEIVAWSVRKKWSGIELLSLIPGRIGGAPVQNIGAYGGEISKTLIELTAFDTQLHKFVIIKNKACGFGYRTSRFKTSDKGRFLITSITLLLGKQQPKPPFYESLDSYFKKNRITKFDLDEVRQAVIAVRNSKLPDPAKVANNGSFFTNPIVEAKQFTDLKKRYPDIKAWELAGGKVKISAGWMLEKAGFKGIHDEQTGMATWPAQALVLVNENAKNTGDLLTFKQKIESKVYKMFGLILHQEPELLP